MYTETAFHVSDTTPDGAEYTVERVTEVRKIYSHKVFKDKYMLDQVVYPPLGVQVTVNYDADSPFMVSSSFA